MAFVSTVAVEQKANLFQSNTSNNESKMQAIGYEWLLNRRPNSFARLSEQPQEKRVL
jgi:hypothetical protein